MLSFQSRDDSNAMISDCNNETAFFIPMTKIVFIPCFIILLSISRNNSWQNNVAYENIQMILSNKNIFYTMVQNNKLGEDSVKISGFWLHFMGNKTKIVQSILV